MFSLLFGGACQQAYIFFLRLTQVHYYFVGAKIQLLTLIAYNTA